jgi:rhamnogalacturonan endolyase
MLLFVFFRCALILSEARAVRPPFFKRINAETHIIGNDIWNVTVGRVVGKKLYYKGAELVGRGAGHFASYSMITIALKDEC